MTTGTSASPGSGRRQASRPAEAEIGGDSMADPAARSAGRHWGTGRGGMRWGAVWTLGPYLLALIGVLVWPSYRDQFVFIAAATAPFATLATGATWLLVLALQRGPGWRWAGILQGLVASVTTYAVGTLVLLLNWLA